MAINTSGFGAYDIRGVYPESINQELAYRVGRVFPEIFNAKKVVVGHDIRLSGPTIFDALSRGLTEVGCDVYDIGQCGTEMIYFATGFHDFDGGIMITASHNPKEYNGMKFVGRGVRPVAPKSGLLAIKAAVEDETRDWSFKKATGTVYRIDIQPDYIKCILSYVDAKNLKPLKVVINTGNGAAGPIINELEKFLPFEIIKVHNNTNGYFPNGVPNPLLQDARAETSAAVVECGAACGVAFTSSKAITWSACLPRLSSKKIPARKLSATRAQFGIRLTLQKNSAARLSCVVRGTFILKNSCAPKMRFTAARWPLIITSAIFIFATAA